MDTTIYYWISGGLFLLGVILFFVLASRRKYRSVVKETKDNEHIEHYTKIRDKVTVRKLKVKKVSDEGRGVNLGSIVATLFGIGITIFVGIQVMNAVQTSLCDNTVNVSAGMAGLGNCVNGQIEGGLFSTIMPFIVIGGCLFIAFSGINVFRNV